MSEQPKPQARAAFAVVEVGTGAVVAVRMVEENAHDERRRFDAGTPGDYEVRPCTVLPDTAPLPPDVVARAREEDGEVRWLVRELALRLCELGMVPDPRTAGLRAVQVNKVKPRVRFYGEARPMTDEEAAAVVAAYLATPRPAPAGEVG